MSLEAKCKEVRKEILKICSKVGHGHITSTFSCVEILVALYYGDVLRFDAKDPKWHDRDRFILSKGQAAIGLYYILGDLGFFDKKEVGTFAQDGSRFALHPSTEIQGIENKSGSLGHGLGIASGIAYALKIDGKLPLVYCLMGDAECYEGSVWESAMFASHNNLNNLVAIIDRNWLSATDFTENMLALEPLVEKWQAFGWDVYEVNGHCISDLIHTLNQFRNRCSTKPAMIIADTIKGRGMKSICHQPLWHMRTPMGEEAERGICEIEST